MKKPLLISIGCLLLAAGLFLILFDPVSTEINRQQAAKVTEEFDGMIEQAQQTQKEAKEKAKSKSGSSSAPEPTNPPSENRPTSGQLKQLYTDSKIYNKNRISNQGTVDTDDFTKAALNLSSYGIGSNLYCYLSAPKIGLKLPVYLGANDSVLNYGAAHLSNTSLPIDQKHTNSVIAGHTGFRGRVFFDNIGSLSVGDEVIIKNFWQTIHYKVIKKKIVEETQAQDLYIRYGKQLLTLITCVSNGKGGFDRRLVICEKA